MKGKTTMTLEGKILAEIAHFKCIAFKTDELADRLGASEAALRAFAGKNIGGAYKCELWPGKPGCPERISFQVVDDKTHQALLNHINAELAKPTQRELTAAAHEQERLRDAEFLAEVERHIDKEKRAVHLEALRADASGCIVAPSLSVTGDEESYDPAREPEPEVAAKLAQDLQDSERKKGVVISIADALNRIWPKRSQAVDKFSAVPLRQSQRRWSR